MPASQDGGFGVWWNVLVLDHGGVCTSVTILTATGLLQVNVKVCEIYLNKAVKKITVQDVQCSVTYGGQNKK